MTRVELLVDGQWMDITQDVRQDDESTEGG